MSNTANEYVAVLLSTELMAALLVRYPKAVSAVVEQVVWDFLDRTEEDHHEEISRSDHGLRWERVFLPEGTKLRTKRFGEFTYASVVGDGITYGDEEYSSVSRAVRAMRGDTSVNAWLNVELMRPTDKEWIKASSIR